jgi:preprotein translocase subunit Sec61beta
MRPARFLTLMVPAGVEKFFEEVGKPVIDPSSPPSFEEEDLDEFLAIAPRYSVEILLPNS